MITKLLLTLLASVVSGVVSAFPSIPVPGWAQGLAGQIQSVANQAQGLGYWLPVNLAFTVVAVVIAARLVGYSIKLVRIVASFFTAGGGSAA